EPVVANNTAAQQTPVNRVPVGPPRRFDLWANEPLNVPAVRGLLSSVKDVDGDRLRAVLVQPPSSGVLRLNNNGSFRYEPRRSFHGVVTFRYRVFDGFRFSEPIVVTLHIQPHGRRSF
ncbi:MAG: Ig-like domain-containing protein, partial [Gemmataceae bacterium]